MLSLLEEALAKQGYRVLTASSGSEAYERALVQMPDLIVLDIIMPGMDGFEVLKQLRAFSQLPVIVFSASPGNHDSAIRLGANDFVIKPFLPDEMVRRMETILSQ